MASAKPKKIPKTISRPADPSAPSILTTLPPEIRNTIYEVLFKRDDPVLLHDADAYYPKPPKRRTYHTLADYTDEIESYKDFIYKIMHRSQEFKHGFGNGLATLLSCRQIYHEGVGVLYGSNTFIISRALHSHDNVEEGSWEYNGAYNQFAYAPKWLAGIGTHINLLRQVLIDVDATCPLSCPLSCPTTFQTIQILPLLRLFWLHPGLEHKVAFSTTKRQILDLPWENGVHQDVPGRSRQAVVLNNLLKALGTKDTLNLKQYSHFHGLLESVLIENAPQQDHVTKIWVHFAKLAQGQAYESTDKGLTFAAIACEPPRNTLSRLPEDILHNICKLSAYTKTGIVYDLDSRTMRGLHMSIAQLDWTFRRLTCLWTDIVSSNKITLKASATRTTTSFNHFAALKDLQDLGAEHSCDPSPLYLIVSQHYNPTFPLKIELHFSIDKESVLTDLTIDIHQLLVHLCGNGVVAMQILLTSGRNGRSRNEAFDVDMDRLQMDLFLVLVDIWKQWPATSQMPVQIKDICIDGRGEVQSITCLSTSDSKTFAYANAYLRNTKEEMNVLGYSQVLHYRRLIDELRDRDRWQRSVSSRQADIESLMSRLQRMCWKDF